MSSTILGQMAGPIRLTAVRAALGFVLVMCPCRPAQAANDPSDEATRWLQLELGGQVAFVLGTLTCERELDTIECQNGMPVAGVELGGQYRFMRRFALGAVGNIGWDPGRRNGYVLLWRAAPEGRFYPVASDNVDLWLSLEVGLAVAHAALHDIDFQGRGRIAADHHFAAEFGGGLGADFYVRDGFGLALVLRALVALWAPSDQEPLESHLDLGTSVWVSVGIDARYRLPI